MQHMNASLRILFLWRQSQPFLGFNFALSADVFSLKMLGGHENVSKGNTEKPNFIQRLLLFPLFTSYSFFCLLPRGLVLSLWLQTAKSIFLVQDDSGIAILLHLDVEFIRQQSQYTYVRKRTLRTRQGIKIKWRRPRRDFMKAVWSRMEKFCGLSGGIRWKRQKEEERGKYGILADGVKGKKAKRIWMM